MQPLLTIFMNSSRFQKLVENCRAIAWNHPLSTVAKGWNDACVASGDSSFIDAWYYSDEVVEIYSSYNSTALRVVRVENWNPTTVIDRYGKVVRNHAEQWKLEERINTLAAQTPTIKKTAFFSQYFRHICLHVQPTATTSSSIELRENSLCQIVIENLRVIDRQQWDKISAEALKKVALLYSEAAKVIAYFDREHNALIGRTQR